MNRYQNIPKTKIDKKLVFQSDKSKESLLDENQLRD